MVEAGVDIRTHVPTELVTQVASHEYLLTLKLDKSGGTMSGNLSMGDGAILEIATGSDTIPSIRGRTDPNTGLSIPLSDQINFICGGLRYACINTTGLFINTNAYLGSTTADSSDTSVLSRKEITSLITDAVAQTTLNYYYSVATDSGNSSFYKLLTSPIVDLGSTTSPALSVNDTWVLMDKYISPYGSPNITKLKPGIYRSVRYKTKSAATSDASIVGELRKYSTASVSTLIATSSIYTMTLDGIEDRVTVEFSVPSLVTFASTDRLEIRSYATKRSTGGGGNPTLTNWYGDGKQGFFSLPIDSALVMRTDMSNADSSIYNRYTTVTTVATTTFYPGFSFASGGISLFISGILQEPSIDYTETSSSLITTLSSVASGTRITILKR